MCIRDRDSCVPLPKKRVPGTFQNGRNVGRDLLPGEGTALKGTNLNKIINCINNVLIRKGHSLFEHTSYFADLPESHYYRDGTMALKHR